MAAATNDGRLSGNRVGSMAQSICLKLKHKITESSDKGHKVLDDEDSESQAEDSDVENREVNCISELSAKCGETGSQKKPKFSPHTLTTVYQMLKQERSHEEPEKPDVPGDRCSHHQFIVQRQEGTS